MTFPDSPRVIYERNSLEEVLCQLRFPAILKVDTDTAAFQERIRAEYPIYREETVSSLPPEIVHALRLASPMAVPPTARHFLTGDETWTVALTREFVALSTTRYRRWEEFRQRLQSVVDALVATYAPAFFGRIGLRYRNGLEKGMLGAGAQWGDLLKPHVAAELSSAEMAGAVAEAAHIVLFKLENDEGKVRLRHGLEPREGVPEPVYVLDADFFADGRTEIPDALDRLGHFNRQARRLFRWCITDALHNHLEPREIT